MTPLIFIALKSHRAESTVMARFRNADVELARLMGAKLIEYHDSNCTAVRVTAAGRSALKAEREAALAEKMRAA